MVRGCECKGQANNSARMVSFGPESHVTPPPFKHTPHPYLNPPHPPVSQGEQERELVRVTIECCLQERAWNPYYALLLAKLCEASKSHKVTLQVCCALCCAVLCTHGGPGPLMPRSPAAAACAQAGRANCCAAAVRACCMHRALLNRQNNACHLRPPTWPHPPLSALHCAAQYCLWDHLKEVAEGSLEVRRMTNLARLLAAVIASGGLPSTTLKVGWIDGGAAGTGRGPKITQRGGRMWPGALPC